MGLRGSLFREADKTDTVAAIRADRLAGVAEDYFSGLTLSDDYIWAKLQAAEADAAHRLRCFLVPTVMVPEGVDDSVRDAYTDAGTPWHDEPAYDWDPMLFKGEQWGFMQTRNRPVVKVTEMRFIYPGTYQSMYEIPQDWLKIDKKYGHIRLVPSGHFLGLPLEAWLLKVFSGGRSIPHMLQIFYVAGLENATVNHPDLVDLIKRMAVLRILRDQFPPASGSVSADGLSESLSVDLDKFDAAVDNSLKHLRQQIHGVRMAVL